MHRFKARIFDMYQAKMVYIFMDDSMLDIKPKMYDKYAYFDTVDGTRPLYVRRFELIDINKYMNNVNIITSHWHASTLCIVLYRVHIKVNT